MANPLRQLERARAALGAANPKAALRICQKLLTANPRDVDARYLLGCSWASLGRWPEAAAEFRRVITTRVGFYPAMVDFGIAAALSGNVGEALLVLRQARALDSRPAQVHFGLGLCCLAVNDNAGAVQAFTATLQRNPQNADAYNNLGVAYDRLGQLPEACEAFHQAALVQPGSADAHRNHGNVLRRMGNLRAAATALTRALELRPGDAELQSELQGLQVAPGDESPA